jgi:hypothetical protein
MIYIPVDIVGVKSQLHICNVVRFDVPTFELGVNVREPADLPPMRLQQLRLFLRSVSAAGPRCEVLFGNVVLVPAQIQEGVREAFQEQPVGAEDRGVACKPEVREGVADTLRLRDGLKGRRGG